jgi:hypothetical protein
MIRIALGTLLSLIMIAPASHAQDRKIVSECKVEGLRTSAAVLEAQECVTREIRQAAAAADDLKATVEDIVESFNKAAYFAGESDKYKLAYQRTGDRAFFALHEDNEKLYKIAFSNFEKYRTHLESLRRTSGEFNKLIEFLKLRIEVLRNYGGLLRPEK